MITQLCLLVCLLASAPNPAGQTYAISPVRVRNPPKIDGYLTDPCWKLARPVGGFTQFSPEESAPSQEETFVYCVYDANNIYFGFACLDSRYEEMSAKLTPRESYEMGDCVALFLDTFHDRQNAFLFQTNALGIQLDARVFEDGSSTDESWDGIWRAEGRLTTKGWFVEIEIPFKTLRFPSDLVQIWGVQFWRYIERLDETSYWVPVSRAEGVRISRFGRLGKIKDIRPGLHLEIKPHVMGRGEMSQYDSIATDTTTGSMDTLLVETRKAFGDGGLDIKWQITPNVTADATFNPDFGQVEADPEFVNLSRYEYYLEERRPFFLEGRELLVTPYTIFYSRRVGKKLPDGTEVPILGGARLTGKAWYTSFLVAAAATEGVRSAEYREPPALYSVGRIKWDILESSNFGILVAGKDTLDGYSRCTSFDTNLRLFSKVDIIAQGAKSWNVSPDLEGYMGNASARFYTADWSFGGSYTDIDKDFYVGEFGYVPQYGSKSHRSEVSFHPRLNRMGIRSLSASLKYLADKRYEHPVYSQYIGSLISVNFIEQWSAWAGGYLGNKYEVGEERPYSNIYGGVASDYRLPVSAAVQFRQLSTYNYRRQYFGHQRTGYATIEIRPSTNIHLSGDFEYLREYTDDWSLDESTLTASQHLRISLTRDLHLRLYALENTDTKHYTGNGLVEWEFAPQSRIYLAYTEVRNDYEGDMRLEDRIGFIKLTYLLNL